MVTFLTPKQQCEVVDLVASISDVYTAAKKLNEYGLLNGETPEDVLARHIASNPRISEAASYAVNRGLISRESFEPIKGLIIDIMKCDWFDHTPAS